MARGIVVIVALLIPCLSHGATRTWTGAVDRLWSNPGNWDGGVPEAGDELVFLHGEGVVTVNDLPAGTTFGSIYTSQGPWTFEGNAMTLTEGIVSKTATFALPIKAGASQRWTAFCCHIISFARSVDLNGQTLTLTTSALTGDSGVELNAAMTGTGSIVMAAQRVVLGVDGALPAGAAVVVAAGTFDTNDRTASIRSFEMSPGTILAAGTRPLVVSQRVRLDGVLRLRNAFDGMVIVRNDSTFPVEGQFDEVSSNGGSFVVMYTGGDGNDVVVRTSGPALAATSITLTSGTNPARAGSAVTFTAMVASASGTPTGTVTFRAGTHTLGTVLLDGTGLATLTTNALPAGTHLVSATYDGSVTHAISTSQPLSQVILGGRRHAVRHALARPLDGPS